MTLFENANIYISKQSILNSAFMLVNEDGSIFKIANGKNYSAYLKKIKKRIDLKGNYVFPSFHDNHTHPIDSGVEIFDCNLYDVTTVLEFKNTLLQCAENELKANKWIRGSGWDSLLFKEEKKSPLEILDSISLKKPVVLTSSDGHSYLVNSKSLNIAKITKNKQDLKDGAIGRTKDGELNGIFYENAMSLIDKVLPKRSKKSLLEGLRYAQNQMLSFGITSFKDAYVTKEYLDVYRKFEREGELKLHASLVLYADPQMDIDRQIKKFVSWKNKFSSSKILINSVKVFLDGIIEDKTAALKYPYAGEISKGSIQWNKNLLDEFVLKASQAGFQIHFHAIGDAAVKSALNAIMQKDVNKNLRHEISHLQLIDPSDVSLFKALNVVSVFSPLWAEYESHIERLIGKKRMNWIYPMGSIDRVGADIAFGSDWSVTSMNPWEGISQAISRKDLLQERLSLAKSIDSYTQQGAKAIFREKITGSLEAGKLADFIVIDKNPFKLAPNIVSEIKILSTYKEGKLLWSVN